jgi:hypothetical protein
VNGRRTVMNELSCHQKCTAAHAAVVFSQTTRLLQHCKSVTTAVHLCVNNAHADRRNGRGWSEGRRVGVGWGRGVIRLHNFFTFLQYQMTAKLMQ